ncbi:Methyltransferase type 11 [Beutenbergia cavernae DSM 12333]|uniref:Methyltransferase type 11 n=1 Tax=Beutenbergia cavernae (strain ATCC BAA-8 / DSM 12333 / CCUG 43141 / JCM 11478 / NBRC 16432 / NCIMB 13614 / HKI 0122) TaxID=471853 RepID=C5C3I5_BEUC1|nr:class I SAM-dependent methyltransferase [Beutenbergia cavernae]ACQ81894.1 Methyltransferase type 11 [Beutenbergia cavernae DSM 12333]
MPEDRIARDAGRDLFGADPAAYLQARPGYPDWVYDELVERCGLRPGTATFEIGPGPGTATGRLLELGADPLVAVEPDARLATFLRERFPDAPLDVVAASFEDAPLELGAFDLGVSFTAFHWLPEEAALAEVARLLRPGGWWAACWNVFGDDALPDPFHDATTQLLRGPTGPAAGTRGTPFGIDTDARLDALRRADAFDVVDARTSTWSLELDAERTVALYATFSNVVVRPDAGHVLAELGRIAREEFGGRVVRNMTTSLVLGRRRG